MISPIGMDINPLVGNQWKEFYGEPSHACNPTVSALNPKAVRNIVRFFNELVAPDCMPCQVHVIEFMNISH